MGLVDASWAMSARTLWVHKPYNVSMRIIHVREEKKLKNLPCTLNNLDLLSPSYKKITVFIFLANYESNTDDLIKYRILAAYPALSLCFYFLIYFL